MSTFMKVDLILKMLSLGLVSDVLRKEKNVFSYLIIMLLFVIIYTSEAFLFLFIVFYSWDFLYKSNVPTIIADGSKYPFFIYIAFMTFVSIKKYKFKKIKIVNFHKKIDGHKYLIIGLIILLGLGVLIVVKNNMYIDKFHETKKVVQIKIPYTYDKLQAKLISNKYKQLEKLENSKNFAAIYSIYYPPTYIIEQNIYYLPNKNDETGYPYFYDYYLDNITKYYRNEKIEKSSFVINNVGFIDKYAFVDRILTVCFDTNCNKVSTQEATVKWVKENNDWYTSQEVPLCIKKNPFNISSSIPNLTNFSIPEQNVQIITTAECDMFPINWITESGMSGESLSKEKTEKDIAITRKALKKYPKKLISSTFDKLYILNSLYSDNILRGGINNNKTIVIIDEGKDKNYSDSFIENSIHHEIAHLFVEKYEPSFDKNSGLVNINDWKNINPPNYKYANEQVENLDSTFKDATVDFSPDLNRIGFLTKYSTYDMREDFVIISSWLFMGSKEFWNIVDNNEKIYAKVKLAIKFHERVDPSFNEEYFRSIMK